MWPTCAQEIRRYLKWSGRELMIWRCSNAIVLPTSANHVDLYCQVIGTIRAVSWFYNGKAILLNGMAARIRGYALNTRGLRRYLGVSHIRRRCHVSRGHSLSSISLLANRKPRPMANVAVDISPKIIR